MFNFSANHLVLISRTERSSYALLLMQDRDTQRVYQLYDFSKAQLIQPKVAYCVAGKVNSADKLYLVVESVRPDTKHRRDSNVPVTTDRRPAMTARAPVCGDASTAAFSGVKTAKIAALLSRCQQFFQLVRKRPTILGRIPLCTTGSP